MPKHVPTFKHLIASSSTSHRPQKKELTVNDILSRSRQHTSYQPTPDEESSAPTQRPQRAWDPSIPLNGLDMVESEDVHPAELARRDAVARQRARRGVAGPAPPPSWSATASTPPSTASHINTDGRETMESVSSWRAGGSVTEEDLRRASSLFTESPKSGSSSRPTPPSLLVFCLEAVLRHLNDDTPLYVAEDSHAILNVGEATRQQIGYLDVHLKARLLQRNSFLSGDSKSRLSDASYLALLHDLEDEFSDLNSGVVPDEAVNGQATPDHVTSNSLEYDDAASPLPDMVVTSTSSTSTPSSVSWDQPTTSSTLHHLPLTLHPSPLSILRQLPSFSIVSLTSLNLAYSLIPNLERLISVLPISLRELGLCGIQVSRKAEYVRGGGESWRRGLSALARKFIVLRILDLSEPPFPIRPTDLFPLLIPDYSRLPSLRILSLRGSFGESRRDDLMNVIRSRDRKRWIDVVRE